MRLNHSFFREAVGELNPPHGAGPPAAVTVGYVSAPGGCPSQPCLQPRPFTNVTVSPHRTRPLLPLTHLLLSLVQGPTRRPTPSPSPAARPRRHYPAAARSESTACGCWLLWPSGPGHLCPSTQYGGSQSMVGAPLGTPL